MDYLYGLGFIFLAFIVISILILIAIIKAVAKKVVCQELEKRFGEEGAQLVASPQPQIIYAPTAAPISNTVSMLVPNKETEIENYPAEVATHNSTNAMSMSVPNVKSQNDLTGLTKAENMLLLDATKKQRSIYIISYCVVLGVYAILGAIIPPELSVIISLVVTAMLMVLGGFGAFSHNVVVYLRSNGKRRNGGIVSWIWAFFGGLVIGWFVSLLCNKLFPTSLLGWRNLKTDTDTKASSANDITQSGNSKNIAGNNTKGLSKTGKIWFGLISVLYAAWLVLGLIGIISPETQILWDADDPFTVYALNRVTGVIMLATAFTYLIFFAFGGIVKCKKLTKSILLVVALVGCLVCDVVYFLAFPEELEILAYSHVTDIAFLKLGDRLMFTIALIASEIGLALLGLVGTRILKSKREPNWAQFLITIVLTYLMFVAVGAVIAIAVIVLCLLGWKLFLETMEFVRMPSDDREYEFEFSENGRTVKLRHDVGDIYYDDSGSLTRYKKVNNNTIVRESDGVTIKIN